MQILWLSGREITYPRNDVLLRALQRFVSVDVVDPVLKKPRSLFWRSISITLQSIPYLITKPYDLIVVGFYGHLIMVLISLFTKSPVLFDAFISTYDTICFDRKLFRPGSIIGRLAYWLDKISCQKAKMVLLDTPGHVDYFHQVIHIPLNKMKLLPVGCNEDIFYPRKSENTGFTQVLFYSTYQPLHGVDTVIRAAKLLQSESKINFRIIGGGQTYHQVISLAEELDLNNVTFLPSIPFDLLPNEISAADICLGGHFGRSDKANRVIPGKIYQILAMGKPLIASNTYANQELLTHGENAYLCNVDDSRDLAVAISKLHQDVSFRNYLAKNGRNLYIDKCSELIITKQMHSVVQNTLR